MAIKAEDNLNMDALEALQIIECPVCTEILSSPVFQCPNGHLICSNCLARVSICPTCRIAMPKQRIRNLVVDNLVSLKCPNYMLGCQARFNRREKKYHLLNCEFRSRDYCCSIELKKDGFDCNKLFNKLELPLHMKDEHKLAVIEDNDALFSQELSVKNLTTPRKWWPVLFSAFDDHFILACEIIPDQSGSRASISWKCISAGSVAIAKQFSVTMTLVPTTAVDISLKWKGNVISIDQLQGQDFFSLSLNTVKELAINKSLDKVSWKMHIFIQRKNSIAGIQNPVAKSSGISMAAVEPTDDVEEMIEGKYQLVSGDLLLCCEKEIAYSRSGFIWTRKVDKGFEYSFTLGKEFARKKNFVVHKSTISIEDYKLAHREKLYQNGRFLDDTIQVEEFSDNQMVSNVSKGGSILLKMIFKKVIE